MRSKFKKQETDLLSFTSELLVNYQRRESFYDPTVSKFLLITYIFIDSKILNLNLTIKNTYNNNRKIHILVKIGFQVINIHGV